LTDTKIIENRVRLDILTFLSLKSIYLYSGLFRADKKVLIPVDILGLVTAPLFFCGTIG
jgi:hypothetical protein